MDNYTNFKESMEGSRPTAKTFYCGLCGKGYESAEARHICESKCIKERQEAEAKLKQQKREEEKNKSMENIEAKTKELHELICAHVKEFGSISLSNEYYDDTFPSLSKLIGRWWF